MKKTLNIFCFHLSKVTKNSKNDCVVFKGIIENSVVLQYFFKSLFDQVKIASAFNFRLKEIYQVCCHISNSHS